MILVIDNFLYSGICFVMFTFQETLLPYAADKEIPIGSVKLSAIEFDVFKILNIFLENSTISKNLQSKQYVSWETSHHLGCQHTDKKYRKIFKFSVGCT